MTEIVIEIDRLVLHGIQADDRRAVVAALTAELERSFVGATDLPGTDRALARVDAGTIAVGGKPNDGALGRRTGAALATAVGASFAEEPHQ